MLGVRDGCQVRNRDSLDSSHWRSQQGVFSPSQSSTGYGALPTYYGHVIIGCLTSGCYAYDTLNHWSREFPKRGSIFQAGVIVPYHIYRKMGHQSRECHQCRVARQLTQPNQSHGFMLNLIREGTQSVVGGSSSIQVKAVDSLYASASQTRQASRYLSYMCEFFLSIF